MAALIEPTLLRQVRERHGSKSLEFLDVLEILPLDGDLFLKPLSISLKSLELLLLGSHLLSCIFLDHASPEPRAEHA